MKLPRILPYLLLPTAMLALIIGIITGWERLGISLSTHLPHGEHGALIVGCFLGGLVMLERAVAVGQLWAYSGSALCGLSLLLFLAGQPAIGIAGITLAACMYILVLLYQQIKQPDHSLLVSILGGFCLLTGNSLLFLHDLYPLAVNWWVGFLLFTILGERLSLSDNLRTYKLRNLMLVSFVFIGLLLPFHWYGARIFGISLVVLGGWLLYSENYTFQLDHYKRYMNTAMILAYSWLIVTGGLMLSGGIYYDAQLHSFFIGFVFSMIFAHAPLMLQRVLKFSGELYHPFEFALLLILQVSLLVRISGRIAGNEYLIRWGGFTNGIIIMLFLLTIATVAWNVKKKVNYEGY